MDFGERLKLPLVSNAFELAAHLGGVKPNPEYQPNAVNGYSDCKWAADAPCHDSKSGRAFVFGDASSGGVTIRCMSCSGGGLYQRVEDALGVRIQMRRSDGSFRYWQNDKPPKTGDLMPKSLTKAPPPEHAPLNALPLPDGYTLGDMFAAKRWFLANGKKPATFKWKGTLWGFRQSLPIEDGGAAAARDGGVTTVRERSDGSEYSVRILGWESLSRVEMLRAKRSEARGFGIGLALTGDETALADGALAVVDFDYKPDADSDGKGAAWRDAVKAALASFGCPIWDSTSGNGFHAVFGIPEGELGGGWLWQSEPEAYPQAMWHGARIDLFAAGCKRLVAIRTDKPAANISSSVVIPLIGRERLNAAIRGG